MGAKIEGAGYRRSAPIERKDGVGPGEFASLSVKAGLQRCEIADESDVDRTGMICIEKDLSHYRFVYESGYGRESINLKQTIFVRA